MTIRRACTAFHGIQAFIHELPCCPVKSSFISSIITCFYADMYDELRLSGWGYLFFVPLRALLVSVGDIEHSLLVKRFSHYLKPYRKVF